MADLQPLPQDTGEFLAATQNKIEAVQFSDIRSGLIKILRVWSFRLDTHRPVQQAELQRVNEKRRRTRFLGGRRPVRTAKAAGR
jgi:hypothetical protein